MTAYRNLFLLMGMFLPMVFTHAAVLPVIPYPQFVKEGKDNVSMPVKLLLTGKDSAMQARLLRHWQLPAASGPQEAISLYIISGNATINALVRRYAQNNIEKIGKEGYILVINHQHRFIAANDEVGLFYGLQTLRQLTGAHWKTAVTIIDWPDFPARVVFDDISRGPISTVDYIKKQIQRLAELKVNYLSFYIEHVVQPLSHPDFAPADGKLTIRQIRELSDYAADYHMQLVGNFQSFGHFEKILALPQYRHMGESATLISPLDDSARIFLKDVIGELCDAFSAPWFNVNCDETFGIDKGRSAKYVDSVGIPKFYAGFLQLLYDVVKQHGKKMMMWGDMALKHTEILDLLPRDIMYLSWEYGDQANFDQWIKPFARRGLQYMVCPGIVNSYRMFPDMIMAKKNIGGFIKQGRESGAAGVFTTVWDDGGTYLFDADWYGVYLAADKSWNTGADGFDLRFENVAYGTYNGNYVNALFTLMQLREQPVTYNLNDQLWKQQIVPDSGKQMILNNNSIAEALHIVRIATSLSHRAVPALHPEDLAAMQLVIHQYELMLRTRQVMVDPDMSTDSLVAAYKATAETFRKLWLNENQPYWLDTVLHSWSQKVKELQELPARRKDIIPTTSFYFTNWLLCGNLPSIDGMDKALQPSPGDVYIYDGNKYRWQKFAATNGGIIDLEEKYLPSVVYAYCQLQTDSARVVDAWLTAGDSTVLYCNGHEVKTVQNPVQLPLHTGINHILIRSTGNRRRFTFRLRDDLVITNHKHKYQINSKTNRYEVD
ncbi:glycoside hydrolase family 20 zincin-like fold domain-containing protein [Chitinophaga sp. LS1]|uniref:glycoside hydrolase family 20 zincin-like fold domain-containing protein n=1 Tax=Chitinophaga sp. LS1 TaxID=3051176 RepID=UPI002AAAEB20|nr:glycoside hydrolase family 20 zincin-like fold domain-containing protein [Chitinophaga sp. LS1]WPV65201.1 glycoside hydrolase family 20 zincin-like fold domain-containing protein [Chitinophaga sp. LS1]